MARRPTLLKALLRERHWQKYATFCRQYDLAAHTIEPGLAGTWPSRGQFARWLGGDLKGLPHPDHCRVLEAMLPGNTARELFSPSGPQSPISDIKPPKAVASHKDTDDVSYVLAGTLGEEIAMATEESATFVRAGRGTAGADTLEQFEADVRHLALDYLRRPPHLVFRSVNRLRGDVFRMLGERQRPDLLRRLYGVGGRLCGLLAHASFDLGQAHAAQTHARSAWICADLADDAPLRAYIRWVESNVAYWNGDYQRAADIAHSARVFANTGTSMLRLTSQEARAHAARGDARAVDRALAKATDAAEAYDGHDDGGGVFCFEPGKAAYYASEARVALGGAANIRRAKADAARALDMFTAVPQEEQCAEFIAAARLDLTAAHLADGDLDGAQDVLGPILDLPVTSRTVPVVGRMVTAAAVIAEPRFARSALGSQLTRQIDEFCATPAIRALPAGAGGVGVS